MYPLIHIVLPSYGVFAMIGFIAAVLFLFFRIEKYNLMFTDFLKMSGLSLVYGAIGSRVLFVISRIPWIFSHFSIKKLLSTILGGGFVFYGGLFGLLLGVYRYSKKHNYNIEKLNNMIAPAIPLFHSIGRIGCFMAGCCYGFNFPGKVSVFGLFAINRFPTQIIEAIFEFILFILICILQKKKGNINSLKIYLICYALFRFIIEFTRGDSIRGVFWGISTSQIVSLIILIYFVLKHLANKQLSPTK